MCGIAGIVSIYSDQVHTQRLKGMTDILSHRGPDGEGQWISDDGLVGLGHRRLSIIDLSASGSQPMHFRNRYTITFNGEIYNYIELRELCLGQGYEFLTKTDTEVLMALYDWKGVDMLNHLDGMFAFAIYDSRNKQLFAARDRFGEKPFYYAVDQGSNFIFASEMKALWASGVKRDVNNKMLYNYLQFGYITNPNNTAETFFNNISLLPQSHYIILNTVNLQFSIKKYFDIDYSYQDYSITEDEASNKFKELFFTSVSRRLRSDVPIGSSLSGGLDSSAVVCTIDQLNKEKSVKQITFSAVFPGFEYDESKYIKEVLSQLNVDAYFTTPDANTMLSELHNVFYYHEEPFISTSMLAQYEVMKLAKEKNVTVLLDGQGADEILAGYHPFFQQYFQELKVRDRRRYAVERSAYLNLHGDNKANPIPGADYINSLKKMTGPFKEPVKNMYNWFKHKKNPIFNNDFLAEYAVAGIMIDNPAKTLNHALYNSLNWGMTQLLRYGDRSSMAHSREVRLPFLNHELVEFIFSLPPDYKIRNGWTKYIQRKAFEGIVPDSVTWRKDKIGYEPPQKSWMMKKEVQDEIMGYRELLVKEGVLNKHLLHKGIQPARPSESNDGSWQHWMAGILLAGK
jgi:asparagine synthase (glutamine-hydrolysing)